MTESLAVTCCTFGLSKACFNSTMALKRTLRCVRLEALRHHC